MEYAIVLTLCYIVVGTILIIGTILEELNAFIYIIQHTEHGGIAGVIAIILGVIGWPIIIYLRWKGK